MFDFMRRKKPVSTRPWFGPVVLAQPELRSALEAIPSFRALVARGWEPHSTLVYAPVQKESFDAEIYVLARMFAWDNQSPVIWMFSTVGLCSMEQPVRERRAAFRRFELVLATNNSESDDPFPARLGVALTHAPATLPGWDWAQVEHPPIVRWLALIAQDFASWMKQDGLHFAITDTLRVGPGKSSWTRCALAHSILLPATPHMLLSGLAPFNAPSDPLPTIDPGDWNESPGTSRFEHGFYWLMPVSEAEREKADAVGSWEVFADLVERAPAEARDDCAVAFDWLRSG